MTSAQNEIGVEAKQILLATSVAGYM